MDKLPQEILREVCSLLDIQSIINISQTSKPFNRNKLWPVLLRELAVKLHPLLGYADAEKLNWKTVALHAFYAQNFVPKRIDTGRMQLDRLLNALLATKQVLKDPTAQQQNTREMVRGMLNDIPGVVYSPWTYVMCRAPLLYWIFQCTPLQKEDTKIIAEIALDEVLKNNAAVNIPVLPTFLPNSIDWPINAAARDLWTEGVKRFLQVENIALDVVSTVTKDYQRSRVSPLHCVIFGVTNRQLLSESKNLSIYDIQAEHEHRFVSRGVHRTITLSEKVLPVRARGLEILQLLLTRVNPNQPNGAITDNGGDILLAQEEDTEESGLTALHMASYYQVFGTWIDGIKALIEAGADVNAQTTQTKLTPLHMLFANIQHLNERFSDAYWSKDLELSQLQAVVELFLAHGADLSLTTSDGMNVIHYALVAHKHMSFDQSLITLMQQHCASAASVSLPWSVCMRCKKRYDVNGNNSTACAIHTENFDEFQQAMNPAGSNTYPCCDGEENSRGCSLDFHQ